MSRKVLNWTEFENQIDQLAIGWTLTAEMRKGELTEVGRIKRKDFLLLYFSEPVMHHTLDHQIFYMK